MVKRIYNSVLGSLSRLHTRARSVPKNPSTLLAIKSILLILGSLGLGSFCHSLSASLSLEGWLSSHSPAPSVWTLGFSHESYKIVSPKDPLYKKALVRTESTLIHEAELGNEVWFSDDHLWALLKLPEQPEKINADPPQIWALFHFGLPGSAASATKAPQKWEALGKGWPALEASIKLADRIFTEEKRKAALHPIHVDIDPRQIQY